MEMSKALMKQAGILPKLRLGVKKAGGGVEATGPHKVKMVGEKTIKGVDRDTGNTIEIMKYIVEEDGVKKEYRVPIKDKQGNLHYLIQRLAEVPEGGEVTLEMKKQGPRNYIDVIHEYGSAEDEVDDAHVDTEVSEEEMDENADEVFDNLDNEDEDNRD